MNDSVYQYEDAGYRIVRAKDIFGPLTTLGEGDAVADVGYRAATAEELYGATSVVVPAGEAMPYEPHLSAEPLYHGIAALTLIIYLYMMLRSRRFMGTIWSGTLSRPSEQRMGAEGGVLPLQRFKQMAACIGAIVVTLVIVRLADDVIPAHSVIYVEGLSYLVMVASLLLIVVYVAWYYALHKIVGWVTYSDMAATLSSIGYMNFVRCVTLLYPIVMVWLLASDERSLYMTIIVVVCSSLLLLLYLKDTFLFFISKKISILYFILYLCTAILLPMSFILHLLPTYLV